MCQPASFVLTKSSIFWSMKSDRHEDIIEEHRLVPDGALGPNVLRVKIVPPGGDMGAPSKKWTFGYDQDVLPEWANRLRDEARTRRELKKWRKARVFTRGDHDLKDGSYWLLGNSTATLWGNSTATLWDNSTATLWDNSTATLRDNSTATKSESDRAVVINRRGVNVTVKIGLEAAK
jgi:hypothetical protein